MSWVPPVFLLGGSQGALTRAELLGIDRAPHCPHVGMSGVRPPPPLVPSPPLTSLSTEKHPEHSWCGRRRPPPRVPACRGKESAPHRDLSGAGTAGPSEQWDTHGGWWEHWHQRGAVLPEHSVVGPEQS